jgi:hypothetical protein
MAVRFLPEVICISTALPHQRLDAEDVQSGGLVRRFGVAGGRPQRPHELTEFLIQAD